MLQSFSVTRKTVFMCQLLVEPGKDGFLIRSGPPLRNNAVIIHRDTHTEPTFCFYPYEDIALTSIFYTLHLNPQPFPVELSHPQFTTTSTGPQQEMTHTYKHLVKNKNIDLSF